MNLDKTIDRLITGKKLTVCCFGDSLTQGWMVRKGYTDFLIEFFRDNYEKSDITMVNRGIPGDTSAAGLHRLRGDVIDQDPDLVLVQFALNDAYLGYPLNSFKSNITAITESIINNTNSEIILLTSCFIPDSRENAMAEKFYAAIADTAQEKDIPLCQVHEYWKEQVKAGADHRLLVQGDGVHPTVEGYRLMAEAVMNTIQSSG